MTRHALFPKYVPINHRCRVEIYKCDITYEWKVALQYRYIYRNWFGFGKLKSTWRSSGYSDETIVNMDRTGLRTAIFKVRSKRKAKLEARKRRLEFSEVCEKLIAEQQEIK